VNALQNGSKRKPGQRKRQHSFSSSRRLQNSSSYKHERQQDERPAHLRDGNNWRAYVLMELPMGAANAQLMDEIKKNKDSTQGSGHPKSTRSWTPRFRSTKSGRRLRRNNAAQPPGALPHALSDLTLAVPDYCHRPATVGSLHPTLPWPVAFS